MEENSLIEWTQNTFNPWIGCTKVSPGCLNCYAEKGDGYRHWTPQGWGKGKPRHRTSEEYWKAPLKWNRAATESGDRAKVFCASLADVFDQEVNPVWRTDLWNLIRQCPHLDWQLLTKRPQDIAACLPDDWGRGWPNVWLGTSVENQELADERIPCLTAVPARIHFLSVEPLLGPIEFQNLHGVEWIVVGGESGGKARPMQAVWVDQIKRQCREQAIAFFFKQWGGPNKAKAGRTLNGRIFDEFPPLATSTGNRS